jgi:hypothetical protein
MCLPWLFRYRGLVVQWWMMVCVRWSGGEKLRKLEGSDTSNQKLMIKTLK